MIKKFLLFFIRTLVSVSLIYFLILKIGKGKLLSLPQYAKEANFLWIFWGFILFFTAVILGAIRWGLFLESQGVKLLFKDIFNLTYIGFFFSNFLPGVVGGDIVKFYYLGKQTGEMSSSFTSIFMDRIMGLMGLLFIATISLVLSLQKIVARELFPYMIGGILIIFVIFFLILNYRLSFLEKIKWMGLGEKIKRIFDSFQTYRKFPKILFITFSISLIVQFEMIIITYFISLAFHLRISPVYFFLFFPLVSVIMSLPISISGFGTREWAFVFFFSSLPKITKLDALALSLGLYFLTLFTSSWGGFIYMWKGGKLKNAQ